MCFAPSGLQYEGRIIPKPFRRKILPESHIVQRSCEQLKTEKMQSTSGKNQQLGALQI